MFSTRWVEDESWYSVTAHTLLTRGELRVPIFQEGSPTVLVDPRPPLTHIIMAGFFKVLGTNLYSAQAAVSALGAGVHPADLLTGMRTGTAVGRIAGRSRAGDR